MLSMAYTTKLQALFIQCTALQWQANGKPKNKTKKRKSVPARVAVKRMPREESMSSSPEQLSGALEEGELSEPVEQPQLSLSSPSASDSDSEPLEFDDGLDENMLGDAEDRRRLEEVILVNF